MSDARDGLGTEHFEVNRDVALTNGLDPRNGGATPVAHVGVQTGPDGEMRILTRPVLFTEKVPALGEAGDLGLYDFSQYAIPLRRDIRLERSNAPGFTRDTIHFRGIHRLDGFPLWDTAYTPKTGPTLSPFVTLAERA